MKIIEKRLMDTVLDITCDVCEQSVSTNIKGKKSEVNANLTATFGYGSGEDGNVYHVDLCESCFKIALSALKEHRRVLVMFDDEHNLPDEKFGFDLERCSR
ncbi:hypothetical protein [Flavobacterium sp. W21_SRS_FM6]|uniref:hypothetical protein n=1 Tax=Flavobacterium sp. W21_SRS_FM6 TaxID=3240268 RepID=UPI003F92290B